MEFLGSLRRDESRGISDGDKKGGKEAKEGRRKEIEDARCMKKMNKKLTVKFLSFFCSR